MQQMKRVKFPWSFYDSYDFIYRHFIWFSFSHKFFSELVELFVHFLLKIIIICLYRIKYGARKFARSETDLNTICKQQIALT